MYLKISIIGYIFSNVSIKHFAKSIREAPWFFNKTMKKTGLTGGFPIINLS